jgi:hypothetical protein
MSEVFLLHLWEGEEKSESLMGMFVVMLMNHMNDLIKLSLFTFIASPHAIGTVNSFARR